jgi:hypothetical protein
VKIDEHVSDEEVRLVAAPEDLSSLSEAKLLEATRARSSQAADRSAAPADQSGATKGRGARRRALVSGALDSTEAIGQGGDACVPYASGASGKSLERLIWC